MGFDPLLFGAAAVPAWLAAALMPGRWRWAAAGLGLLLVALVLMATHFNLLLQYEVWIQRGMPDKPNWL
jgi:uncharacterized membrane protein